MKHQPAPFPRRTGLTLLEITLAVGLTTLLLVPTVAALQTSLTSWRGVESSHAVAMEKSDGLLFIQRTLKQSDEVLSISSKQIKFRLEGGLVAAIYKKRSELWYEDENKNAIRVIDDLKSITFSGLAADASTPAKTPSDIRIVQATIAFGDSPKQKHEVVAWIR